MEGPDDFFFARRRLDAVQLALATCVARPAKLKDAEPILSLLALGVDELAISIQRASQRPRPCPAVVQLELEWLHQRLAEMESQLVDLDEEALQRSAQKFPVPAGESAPVALAASQQRESALPRPDELTSFYHLDSRCVWFENNPKAPYCARCWAAIL